MLGIAVAILVGLPIGLGLADHAIGHFAVPGGELVNAGLEAAATVTDIVLLDTFTTYDRVAVHNAPEQLVEGHTVFVTLDTLLLPNITNWTADIVGNVECATHVNGEGSFFAGLPIIPRRINEAHVECKAAGIVFVTPDPFYNSSQSYSSPMEPTGVEIPFVAPNGVRGVATEYSYNVVRVDPWTLQQTSTTWYAWSVPLLEPWTHVDGSTKRWYCPIPVARIHEMDVTHFTGWVQDTPPHDLFAMN
ncbi:MAG TPA: hypothetical protein VFH78_07865 [Candidatus Thermoplasmatota archaeon]|nr:hypothetical protein [Candidatus Thermoplasmatota archaeon]